MTRQVLLVFFCVIKANVYRERAFLLPKRTVDQRHIDLLRRPERSRQVP